MFVASETVLLLWIQERYSA